MGSIKEGGAGPPERFFDVVGVLHKGWVDDSLAVDFGVDVRGDISVLLLVEFEGDDPSKKEPLDDCTLVLKFDMYLKSFLPLRKSFGIRIARSSRLRSRKISPLIPLSIRSKYNII